MRSIVVNAARASALAIALGLASGCATTEQLEEVRGIANEALSQAQVANQKADEANAAASNAGATASQALDAAQSAQACCDANTEKLDRMFEKAMRK